MSNSVAIEISKSRFSQSVYNNFVSLMLFIYKKLRYNFHSGCIHGKVEGGKLKSGNRMILNTQIGQTQRHLFFSIPFFLSHSLFTSLFLSDSRCM